MEETIDMLTIFFYSLCVAFFLTFCIIALYLHICLKTSVAATKEKNSLYKKHVVITGGSSGIGKSIAMEAARRGSDVTIIARDPVKLKSARDEILQACNLPLQKIKIVPLDLSKSYDEVEKALIEVEEEIGPIFMLVNCAGTSVCGKMEDLSVDNFKNMINLNYLGSVFPTKAIVSRMKNRGSGHIVFTASQAAMIGIFGYTAYCSSKFALRGLAEALYMETKPYGVSVTVALPPDTDTPGFAEEEKEKLMETRLICSSSGLFSPDTVAVQILEDAIAGKHYSSVGFEGFIQTTLCVGMAPVTSLRDLVTEVFLMGIMRLISVFYLISFESIVRKCMNSKDSVKKEE